jgi:cyclophilin family peptidyl-prolyl cis-trans isomerase
MISDRSRTDPEHLALLFCRCTLLMAVLAAISGCDSKQRGENQSPGREDGLRLTETTDQPAPDHAVPDPEDITSPSRRDLRLYTSDLEGSGELIATIETTEGDIECRLFEQQTPVTVANFVGLARGMKRWVNPETNRVVEDTPLYDGTPFHRVIPGFMIQGGDPTGSGTGGPGYTIPDEIRDTLSHDTRGTLSMATRGPNTGGSQFFITETSAPHLDGRHTIFGRCRNIGVVQAIARKPAGPDNRPEHPARIEDVVFERSDWDDNE